MFAVSSQSGSEDSSSSSGPTSDFEPLVGWNSYTEPTFEDFQLIKAVNEKLPLAVVLDKILQVSVIESEDWITLSCPLPNHRDSSPSFGYHLKKNIFNCFGCSQKGGPVELAAAFLEASKEEVAKDLQKFIPGLKLPLTLKENQLQVKVIYQKLLAHTKVINEFLRLHPEALNHVETQSEALEIYIKNHYAGPISLENLDRRIKLCQECLENYE